MTSCCFARVDLCASFLISAKNKSLPCSCPTTSLSSSSLARRPASRRRRRPAPPAAPARRPDAPAHPPRTSARRQARYPPLRTLHDPALVSPSCRLPLAAPVPGPGLRRPRLLLSTPPHTSPATISPVSHRLYVFCLWAAPNSICATSLLRLSRLASYVNPERAEP